MRLASLLVGLIGSAIVASSSTIDRRQIPPGFSAANHYNAPIPPWESGTQPGWYYGNNPGAHPDLFCLTPLVCTLLRLLFLGFLCPSSPPPQGGYYETFNNLTGATEASDYLTYGLVDTIAECQSMCNSVTGCGFVNTYHDVHGKNGSPQLTCSLYKNCHTSSDATNYGGQTQPDGSVDYITDSDGWCKA